MTRYISLLRGVNVSGQKLIRMEHLRQMYEEQGFADVCTYLQSGNVVFKGGGCTADDAAQKIIAAIQKTFGFDVAVFVNEPEKFRQIIENNPFSNKPEKETTHVYVTFLAGTPLLTEAPALLSKKHDTEEIVVTESAVYLYCPIGYGKTKLNNNYIENRLKCKATTRNWKSCTELYKMASQDE